MKIYLKRKKKAKVKSFDIVWRFTQPHHYFKRKVSVQRQFGETEN